eukprot:1150259-Pelagomonas_calceolata.AAC.2
MPTDVGGRGRQDCMLAHFASLACSTCLDGHQSHSVTAWDSCTAPTPSAHVEGGAFKPTLKKKKGKKKDTQVYPALERIMGYTGSDMSEEEVQSETDEEDEANKEDGVVDREYIKLRAARAKIGKLPGQRPRAP